MFERNRVDNAGVVTVAVEIVLADGSALSGRAGLPPSRAVHKLLDGNDPFLFVELFNGDQQFIPKTQIVSLTLVAPVAPRALQLPVPLAKDADPHRVLGVTPKADWEEIRSAYHRLSKLYHPDVYAAVSLPPEVVAYLDARTKQINAAFRLLKSPRKVAAARSV